jgi:hypothetical protein
MDLPPQSVRAVLDRIRRPWGVYALENLVDAGLPAQFICDLAAKWMSHPANRIYTEHGDLAASMRGIYVVFEIARALDAVPDPRGPLKGANAGWGTRPLLEAYRTSILAALDREEAMAKALDSDDDEAVDHALRMGEELE